MLALGDPGVIQHSVIPVEVPDVLHKFPVEAFRAALCHVRPDFSPIQNHSLKHAPQTGPTVEIQINNGIALSQTGIHRTAVIAVNDPPVQFQGIFQSGIKFFL